MSQGTAINNLGQVAGNSYLNDQSTMGFLYSNGAMTQLGSLYTGPNPYPGDWFDWSVTAGINDSSYMAKDAMSNLALYGLTTPMTEVLQMHSPSKVMYGMGLNAGGSFLYGVAAQPLPGSISSASQLSSISPGPAWKGLTAGFGKTHALASSLSRVINGPLIGQVNVSNDYDANKLVIKLQEMLQTEGIALGTPMGG